MYVYFCNRNRLMNCKFLLASLTVNDVNKMCILVSTKMIKFGCCTLSSLRIANCDHYETIFLSYTFFLVDIIDVTWLWLFLYLALSSSSSLLFQPNPHHFKSHYYVFDVVTIQYYRKRTHTYKYILFQYVYCTHYSILIYVICV